MDLKGRRAVVIGASSGIGRAVAARAARAGAEVVAFGRRADRLASLAEEAGVTAVAGDVTSQEDRRRLVEAASQGGPVDVMVYTVGTAILRPMRETDPAEWAAVLATNVTAANQTLRDMLGALSPDGIVAFLSSETIGQPRSGLGAYGASKAALEESLRGWRVEHPGMRVCCVAVGSTVPTDFGVAFDLEALGPVMDDWARHGLMQEAFMATDEVADALLGTLAAVLPYPGIGLEQVVLRSPSAVIATSATAAQVAADQAAR